MKLKDLKRNDIVKALINNNPKTKDMWRFIISVRYQGTVQDIRYNGYDWQFKGLSNWISISDDNIQELYTRELNPEHFL